MFRTSGGRINKDLGGHLDQEICTHGVSGRREMRRRYEGAYVPGVPARRGKTSPLPTAMVLKGTEGLSNSPRSSNFVSEDTGSA